jgi:hypothetical protein
MSLAISIVALALSLSTFLASRYRDRRDLMLRVNERLTTPDQQRGRRLVYEMASANVRVEDLSDEQYSLINNAIGALNILGIYYQRRYIRRKDVLEFWGLNVVRIHAAGEFFLTHRRGLTGEMPWPQLDLLARDARAFLTRNGRLGALPEPRAESAATDP